MSSTLQKRTRTDYSEEEIEHALAALAINPTITEVAKELGIKPDTIRGWKKRFATRYDELRAEILPKMRAKMAAQAEDAALAQGALAEQMATALAGKIKDMSGAELAKAMQSSEVAKGINIDKARLLRGEPTVIIEKRDSEEILESIAKRFPRLVANEAETVDITAVEVAG